MQQIRTFADDRLDVFCFQCDGPAETRDHVPARIFLDPPYPSNLPVVGSCRRCNEGASLDEEYVACLLEIAACGTSLPTGLERTLIAEKLKSRPGLAHRMHDSLQTVNGIGYVNPEVERVSRVIEKIGRALWRFETAETTGLMEATIRFGPFRSLDRSHRESFLEVAPPDLLPEVGSRMMIRSLRADLHVVQNYWEHLQYGRFSYAVEICRDERTVKMIVRDYLAASVLLVLA